MEIRSSSGSRCPTSPKAWLSRPTFAQGAEADHPQEIEEAEKKGGKLPVDFVKSAKIAISPFLGKGLAELHTRPPANVFDR
jgi:hypothetical protein